ncbi:unnamed protein product [Caenorhabditis bovis]|uniref:Copper transport protein n=1 Tax=Caenorhabditis bovis TaxID=2654633 RepID=A0A8S1EG84_9PELO|nr:unnamed protein product [Caenorhabditis bovis]
MDHSAHHNHKDHIGHSAPTAGSAHTMMMHHAMSFHFGTDETILFDFWKTHTAFGMIISCILTMAIAFLMETVRFFRRYRKAQIELGRMPVAPEERLKVNPKLDIIDPIFQLLQLTLAYFLMLIFMTFNVYLCVFTVIGEILSHLLYRTLFPYLDSSVNGHC